jgi:hypothetical protein
MADSKRLGDVINYPGMQRKKPEPESTPITRRLYNWVTGANPQPQSESRAAPSPAASPSTSMYVNPNTANQIKKRFER